MKQLYKLCIYFVTAILLCNNMKIDIGLGLFLDTLSDEIFRITDQTGKLYFEYDFRSDYQICIQRWCCDISDEFIIHTYKTLAQYGFEKKQVMVASITVLQNMENSFHFTNEWLVNKFLPKAIENGYRYAFLVRTDSLFTQLALEDALDMLKTLDGLEARMFNTFADAWAYATRILEK